jgi:hypothetical protein
MSRGLLA